FCFFFSSRRRHTRFSRDWSSDVCSSDLFGASGLARRAESPNAEGMRREVGARGEDLDGLVHQLVPVAEPEHLILPIERMLQREIDRRPRLPRAGWET